MADAEFDSAHATDDPGTSGQGGSPRRSRANLITAAVAGGVLLLTTGVAVGYGVSGRQGTAAPLTTPVGAPSAVGTPTPVTPQVSENEPGKYDPAVTAWHDKAAPGIAAVVRVLSDPGIDSAERMTAACSTALLTARGLSETDRAPRAEVEEAFRAWVDSLMVAAEECAQQKTGESEAEFRERVVPALGESSETFQAFMLALDPYVDFTRAPQPETAAP